VASPAQTSDEALAKDHVRSDLRLSRSEVRIRKERVVLFYAERLQYFLIRSQLALNSCLHQRTIASVRMSEPQSLQNIGAID